LISFSARGLLLLAAKLERSVAPSITLQLKVEFKASGFCKEPVNVRDIDRKWVI
jgi:hypothetical protein